MAIVAKQMNRPAGHEKSKKNIDNYLRYVLYYINMTY